MGAEFEGGEGASAAWVNCPAQGPTIAIPVQTMKKPIPATHDARIIPPDENVPCDARTATFYCISAMSVFA
jgi:hypothetical protein